MDVHGTNVIYARTKSGENNETPLEPNHTQFIFIDDGIEGQSDGEFAFRARFEKAISGESFTQQHDQGKTISISRVINTFISSFRFADSVPVVLLVIDGGRDTIRKGSSHRDSDHLLKQSVDYF